MIVLSVLCTLQLIVSLIDQISKNPIVIYREDTAIDVTKVDNHKLRKLLLISFQIKKIPFPAVTVCEIDTFNDSNLSIDWLGVFDIPANVIPTELGLCRTINFCDQKDYLRDDVDEERIFVDTVAEYYDVVFEPENETRPYMTNSINLGLTITAYYRDAKGLEARTKAIKPFMLIIHSPFEWPTRHNQRFTLVDMDYDIFWVTPQLNTIDDSMIAMDPQE